MAARALAPMLLAVLMMYAGARAQVCGEPNCGVFGLPAAQASTHLWFVTFRLSVFRPLGLCRALVAASPGHLLTRSVFAQL